MYTGVVVGSVVATAKDSALEGVPLLVVQKIENGKEAGLIVAADQTRQAGLGLYDRLQGSFKDFQGQAYPCGCGNCGFHRSLQ